MVWYCSGTGIGFVNLRLLFFMFDCQSDCCWVKTYLMKPLSLSLVIREINRHITHHMMHCPIIHGFIASAGAWLSAGNGRSVLRDGSSWLGQIL